MFTTEKKHHLGKKAFWFFFLTKNKLLLGVLVFLLIVSYIFLFGQLERVTLDFLAKSFSYIDIGLIRLWAYLFLFAYVVILLLRTSVYYKTYAFIFHKHALHVSHGVFFVKEHVMPYSQILNVEIRKSLKTVFFGLVELDIITGLTEEEIGRNKQGMKMSLIPVIDAKQASNIAHYLMSLAAIHNGYEQKDEIKMSEHKKRRRR
jgi:uncharacterized membrane protein YdbT with pleckstrin-like domain